MNSFSKYYDAFVGADYNIITDYIDNRIKKYKSDSTLLCDLGCGTASAAIEMAKRGYDMIAIDSDDGMLMQARDKLSEQNINSVLLLNQDITEFELYGTVDVIYSTLDTINYILYKRDLNRLFYLVRNYLNYDGLFIFDINSKYKFSRILADNCYIYDSDNTFCSWQPEFDKKSGKCLHTLTYFEKNSDGTYRRCDSFQEQRFYNPSYIEELAGKYSFEILEKADNYSDKGVNNTTERVTYVLKINK